jgi:hypothetical protein
MCTQASHQRIFVLRNRDVISYHVVNANNYLHTRTHLLVWLLCENWFRLPAFFLLPRNGSLAHVILSSHHN